MGDTKTKKEIMAKSPDLSIIVPVYNAEKYLKKCLDSITTSIKGSEYYVELIIVNNNSSDNSLSIVKKYAKDKALALSIIECQTPGASAARNKGVKQAHGEYIWFIDADDHIDKKSIKLLLSRPSNDGSPTRLF